MITTQTSTYRQSGWKNLTTGVTEIYYNDAQPSVPENFKKEWDNLITETIVKQPYVAPGSDAPAP